MKSSIKLIILLVISFGNNLLILVFQSKKWYTLEEDVTNTMKNLYFMLSDKPELQHIPEWFGSRIVECAKHYQEFGVGFFYLKAFICLLALISITLIFFKQEHGYWLYAVVQFIGFYSIFYGFGINLITVIAALITGGISILFLKWYNRLFLDTIEISDF